MIVYKCRYFLLFFVLHPRSCLRTFAKHGRMQMSVISVLEYPYRNVAHRATARTAEQRRRLNYAIVHARWPPPTYANERLIDTRRHLLLGGTNVIGTQLGAHNRLRHVYCTNCNGIKCYRGARFGGPQRCLARVQTRVNISIGAHY